jgi:uncharacterized membrane protein YqhA
MLRTALASSRWIVLIAVFGTLVAAIALLVYEAIVVTETAIDAVHAARSRPRLRRQLAVGMIEAVDVFLIAIFLYITSLGLYVLFVDDSLPMPKWFEIHDLEDLKANLVSVVIAVLAVLFLREAVSWEGGHDILAFGAALALVIASLTFFLRKKQ